MPSLLNDNHTYEQLLRASNYFQHNAIDSILNAYLYESRAKIFHNKNGEFASIFAINPYDAKILTETHITTIQQLITNVLNSFPDYCPGSIIRFTSSNIDPLLDRYRRGNLEAFTYMKEHVDEHHWWDKNPYAKSIEDSMVERYRQASTNASGFMGDIDSEDLQQAAIEYAKDLQQDDGLAEIILNNSKDQLTIGMNPVRHTLWFVIKWMPKAITSHSIGDAFYKMKSALGLEAPTKIEYKSYGKHVREFVEFRENIRAGLIKANLSPRYIDADAYIAKLFEILNPKRSRETEPPKYNPSMTIGEVLAGAKVFPSDTIGANVGFCKVTTTPDGFTIKEPTQQEYYYRAASITGRVTHNSPGFIHDVIDTHSFPGWTTVNFYPTSATATKNRLRLRKKLLENKLWSKKQNNKHIADHDLKAEGDLNKIHDTIESPVNSVSGRLFELAAHTVLGSYDKLAVDSTTDSLAKNSMFGLGYFEVLRGDSIIHGTLPLNFAIEQNKLQRRHFPYMSNAAANFFPVFTQFKGTESSGILFANRYGCPIFIDLFGENTNTGHSLIVGTTGTGKSFATNYILASTICKYNAIVRVFDKGGSYEPMCANMDGDYVELTVDPIDDGHGRFTAPSCLNPLHLEKDPVTGMLREPPRESVKAIAFQLITMRNALSKQLPNFKDTFSIKMMNLLFESLRRFFKDWVVKNGIPPTLSDFMGYLRKCKLGDAHGSDLADEMRAFYGDDGIYSPIFDGQLSFSWRKSFIVIETNRMDGDPILGPLVVNLLRQIGDDIIFNYAKARKKIVAVDESWQTLATKEGADVLADFFRTMRKNNCGILLISQFLADFIKILQAEGNSGDDGLLGNTSHFFFLPSAQSDYKLAREHLGFSTEAVEMWDTLSGAPPYYSEFFYSLRDKKNLFQHGICRYVSSSVMYWLSSTNPEDRSYREKLTRKFRESDALTLQKAKVMAINEASRLHPFGVRKGKPQSNNTKVVTDAA